MNEDNGIVIFNTDHLPTKFIIDEITQVEKEKGRKVVKCEFYDNGDGTATERFWFKHVNFQRLRRITGYLVGDVSSFNDAKRAEERDRVKHI